MTVSTRWCLKVGLITSVWSAELSGLYVGTGTKAFSVGENKQLKNARPQAWGRNRLLFVASWWGFTVVKAGFANSLVSRGCIPSASVVNGIRLDPDCPRQDEGMFDFICSSVACWQTLPAHLDLVPDVWVPAIRWLNTPLSSLPPSALEHSGSYFLRTYSHLFCTQEEQNQPKISCIFQGRWRLPVSSYNKMILESSAPQNGRGCSNGRRFFLWNTFTFHKRKS